MILKTKAIRKIAAAFSCAALAFALYACAGINYSFTGGSIDPSIKTITIRNFESEVSLGPANMEIDFTEKLRRHFQRNTRLTLVPEGGDLLLEGAVTSYTITAVAPSGTADQTAELQRLNIGVSVNYVNNKNEEQNFQSTFSNSEDVSADVDFASVERDKMDLVFDNIINDIFNKTVANW